MSDITNRSALMRDELTAYVERRYGAKPEHLWEQYPEYEVFRHASAEKSDKGKWFMLIANTTYEQLGIEGAENPSEVIFTAVVKCDSAEIDELIQKPGYARGYHMNKREWLSILLDGSVTLDEAEALVGASFEATE